MDTIQLNRRANLRTVLDELATEGITGAVTRSSILGIDDRELLAMLRGKYISNEAAREIEWSMQRREGWMDEDHRRETLDL
ncbi:hypothetical protein [Luteibacter aegosomatissinici]|jgi:hypothetical protein|uniref:hypothetical protein n=1 Tax=Luteibacter aegosomatissinici TaxID=2911539 RepID=UPI001FF8119F|nr:hypothetical protein [Luteibacter aegosomatissinici]UPG92512.1 hypothetical protein L2Y97_11585 [Luteibacter aegosomatissinici]